MSGCLFVCVCLSVRSHVTSTFYPFTAQFCYLWPWFGPPLTAQCDMLCTSGFVNDVMLSRNRANGQNDACSSSSPGGGIGSKCAVSDCILCFDVTL